MILLDTNVISEVARPNPAPGVIPWINRRFGECALSSIAIFELRIGVALMPRGKRRDLLDSTVTRLVRRFGARIYGFDEPASHAAAQLWEKARSTGAGLHQLPAKLADLQIAGIALAYGLTLATRNVSDFAGLDLPLINPWTDEG